LKSVSGTLHSLLVSQEKSTAREEVLWTMPSSCILAADKSEWQRIIRAGPSPGPAGLQQQPGHSTAQCLPPRQPFPPSGVTAGFTPVLLPVQCKVTLPRRKTH